MKNIFKLMGIALIASSMALVSCSKDDDTNVMKVTYGDETWDGYEMKVLPAGAMMTATIYGDAEKEYPAVTFMCGTEAKEYSLAGTAYFVSYGSENGEDLSTQTGNISISAYDATAQTISGSITAKMVSEKDLTVEMTEVSWTLGTLEQ